MEWRPSTSIIDGMDPTIEVLSPVALALTSSTLTLLRDDEPLTILTTPLVPDGIRDGRFQYILRVPPAIWQELASSRHDDHSSNWALLHAVFRVNNERLSNVKPFAEVRYDFASSPVPPAEVQASPEISSPVKVKSIFRAFEPPISQEFRDTSPPPPPPPRKRNPPRRRASTPKCELNNISVSVPAVTSNKEEEEEKEEEDTSEQVRYHDQARYTPVEPQHIFFSSTGHIVGHESSQCNYENFDLTFNRGNIIADLDPTTTVPKVKGHHHARKFSQQN
ncbi:hypothetical protein C8R46DRAFT_1199180 [Mycena filopes]|nr:hypothetical protein C8R46DRAFT_1199180 [Mycena filopes]